MRCFNSNISPPLDVFESISVVPLLALQKGFQKHG